MAIDRYDIATGETIGVLGGHEELRQSANLLLKTNLPLLRIAQGMEIKRHTDQGGRRILKTSYLSDPATDHERGVLYAQKNMERHLLFSADSGILRKRPASRAVASKEDILGVLAQLKYNGFSLCGPKAMRWLTGVLGLDIKVESLGPHLSGIRGFKYVLRVEDVDYPFYLTTEPEFFEVPPYDDAILIFDLSTIEANSFGPNVWSIFASPQDVNIHIDGCLDVEVGAITMVTTPSE